MELIENLLQLLTTFVGALLSGISYRKSRRVSGQKQPTVQSRYSANAKHSTPMWKCRIFRAAPVCVFA